MPSRSIYETGAVDWWFRRGRTGDIGIISWEIGQDAAGEGLSGNFVGQGGVPKKFSVFHQRGGEGGGVISYLGGCEKSRKFGDLLDTQLLRGLIERFQSGAEYARRAQAPQTTPSKSFGWTMPRTWGGPVTTALASSQGHRATTRPGVPVRAPPDTRGSFAELVVGARTKIAAQDPPKPLPISRG